MKLIFCFLFFVAYSLALTAEEFSKYAPVIKGCRTEAQVKDDLLQQLGDESQLVQNTSIKKYLLCISKKTGLMSESGDINVDSIKNKLKKQSTTDDTILKVEKCLVKKDTPENTAAEIYVCIHTHNPHFLPF